MNHFLYSESGYTLGRLLDGTKCHLLLDTGASKSFMSKSFYMQCKSLHMMQINSSNISYLPSITCIYNASGCSATLTYIRNGIDTKRRSFIVLSLHSKHS